MGVRGLCLGFQNDEREEEVRRKTVADLLESVATESIDSVFSTRELVGMRGLCLGFQNDEREEEVRQRRLQTSTRLLRQSRLTPGFGLESWWG